MLFAVHNGIAMGSAKYKIWKLNNSCPVDEYWLPDPDECNFKSVDVVMKKKKWYFQMPDEPVVPPKHWSYEPIPLDDKGEIASDYSIEEDFGFDLD